MRRTPMVICSLLVLLLATVPSAFAEEDTPSESAAEMMRPVPPGRPAKAWEVSFAAQAMPSADIADDDGAVGIDEMRMKLSRSYRVRSNITLTPDLSYSFMHIDAPATALLPDLLHVVSAGIRADYTPHPGDSWSLLVSPALAGDFADLSASDLQVRYGLTWRHKSSEKLTLLAGLIYQQGYHSMKFLPIAGAVYRPNESWSVNITAPRPGVSYALRPDLKLNVGVEFSGGEYQLHEENLGARVIRYRDFRFLGGIDFAVAKGWEAEVSAGVAVDRKFEFYEQFDPSRRDLKLADGLFVRVGLKAQW